MLFDIHLRAVVAHLDSPEKWQYFKQQGLQGCAEVLSRRQRIVKLSGGNIQSRHGSKCGLIRSLTVIF